MWNFFVLSLQVSLLLLFHVQMISKYTFTNDGNLLFISGIDNYGLS